jgi:hypothetical protein
VAAAIRGGARGVLLARPRPAAPEALADVIALAAGAGVPVAVDSPLRLDPGWDAALPRLREAVARAALLDCVAVLDAAHAQGDPGGLLAEGLLAQVALVRSLTGPLEAVSGAGGDRAYHVAARAGGAAVGLAGTLGVPAVRLDLVAGDERWQVAFAPGAPAEPTRIAHYGADGGELLPTRYESGRRAVWRHLAAAVADGAPLPYALADLAEDAALAGSAL